ncbi:MAG: PorT family protein [Sphingobacteriales bacterium]|jgi:hypothetical protein|nr:PorT family protein [Sphingobacteriales bacterium]
MKRYVLLSAVLMFTVVAQAQYGYFPRPVRLGFKVDPVFVNSLKTLENGVSKTDSKFGVNYGLMADIMFIDGRGAFATGLEVSHATAGLSYNDNTKGLKRGEATGQQNYDLKLQYLNIPITVKLKTNMNEGFRWWGQFGGGLGALIRSRADYSYAKVGGGNVSETNVNVLNQTNKVNLSLVMGAGGEYRLADRTDLFFGLGFENGFTDITSNKQWNDGKVALNRWAIRLGVFF